MWICLNDAFISIVSKDCERDEVMVRARRPGDIERLFPELQGTVQKFTASDYHYRAAIKRSRVAQMLVDELARVTYRNFKSSVVENDLHNAYMHVWTAMSRVQPDQPYSGVTRRADLFQDFETSRPPQGAVHDTIKPKAKRRTKSGK